MRNTHEKNEVSRGKERKGKETSKIDVSIYNHAGRRSRMGEEREREREGKKRRREETVEASNLSAVIRIQYR